MKKYLVAVAYETGFRMYVEAKNEEDAEKLALEIIGDSDIPEDADILHRDYFVTDSIQVDA